MAFEKNNTLSALLCKVELTPINDVSARTEISVDTVMVTFKSGKSFGSIPFTPGSAEYQCDQKKSDAGPLFEHQVKFFYPGDSSASSSLIFNYHNGRYIVQITDMAGLKKLLGDFVNPVVASIDLESKKGGRLITLTWQSDRPALVVGTL